MYSALLCHVSQTRYIIKNTPITFFPNFTICEHTTCVGKRPPQHHILADHPCVPTFLHHGMPTNPYYSTLHPFIFSSGMILQIAQDVGVLNVQWDTGLHKFDAEWDKVLNCRKEDAVALHFHFNISLDRLCQIDSWDQGASILRHLEQVEYALLDPGSVPVQ